MKILTITDALLLSLLLSLYTGDEVNVIKVLKIMDDLKIERLHH